MRTEMSRGATGSRCSARHAPFGETLPNKTQAGSMRGVHCPECGTKANPGAVTCSACSQPLPHEVVSQSNLLAARTMVGGVAARAASPLVPPPHPDDLPTLVQQPKAAAKVQPGARVPSQVQHTILGGAAPPNVPPSPATNRVEEGPDGTSRSNGAPPPPKDPNAPRQMPHELGATLVPQPVRPRRQNRVGAERLDPDALLVHRDKLARKRVVLPPVRSREEQARADARKKRRRTVSIAVGALAVLALLVVVGVLWRLPPSLSARVRVMPDGHEAIEVDCASCPDGTKISLGDAAAVVAAHKAQIPLVAPLALGENRLKVAVDRPANGRDETVGLSVQVGYRLRPDLSMLNSDKPTLHIALEGLEGTEITLDGKLFKLADGPKAHAIDVSADCTGSSDEPVTLKRNIAYSVKSHEGTRADGNLDIAVGIVALRVDAPGPRVVTESDTFVLSGHTMKGAEVLVAGRPIQVSPDGAFAQRMSVSSIGATNIEVRAKIPGMAPRIVPIAVQRVERLEQAAKEFQKENPVGYTTLALGSDTDVGRPTIVAGQIVEVRTQNHQTIYLLDVPVKDGCPRSSCRVRLVQGATSTTKVGDSITAFGQIGRSTTAVGGPLPEVLVAFMLPSASRASP